MDARAEEEYAATHQKAKSKKRKVSLTPSLNLSLAVSRPHCEHSWQEKNPERMNAFIDELTEAPPNPNRNPER